MIIDPQKVRDEAQIEVSFFEGFEEHLLDAGEVQVFCRIAGAGTPVLLLHGYPQTSAMWHRIAPVLAENYRVICADLTGYGRSGKPETDPRHSPYSKRSMGRDMVALMDRLGHEHFLIGSHDRGARVAHRLAADHSNRVKAVAMLDIAPTREMYRDATSAFAATYWHWYWLIQKAPFPERLIEADPVYFWIRKCCSGSAGAAPFAQQALEEYLSAFSDPKVIHASCEDYRAAFTIDIDHDDADNTRLPMPLLVNWGRDGAIEAHFDCLALWKERAADVQGAALNGGHYLAEECPDAVLSQWLPFFEKHS